MRECDAIIATITLYHDPNADVGMVYEMGFMAALGRLVFASSNDGRLFADRVAAFFHNALVTRADGEREGPDAMALEDVRLGG